MMMSLLDSQGAKRRRKHQLKRRVYQNKVHSVNSIYIHITNKNRALTLFGTWMDMTN